MQNKKRKLASVVSRPQNCFCLPEPTKEDDFDQTLIRILGHDVVSIVMDYTKIVIFSALVDYWPRLTIGLSHCCQYLILDFQELNRVYQEEFGDIFSLPGLDAQYWVDYHMMNAKTKFQISFREMHSIHMVAWYACGGFEGDMDHFVESWLRLLEDFKITYQNFMFEYLTRYVFATLRVAGSYDNATVLLLAFTWSAILRLDEVRDEKAQCYFHEKMNTTGRMGDEFFFLETHANSWAFWEDTMASNLCQKVLVEGKVGLLRKYVMDPNLFIQDFLKKYQAHFYSRGIHINDKGLRTVKIKLETAVEKTIDYFGFSKKKNKSKK